MCDIDSHDRLMEDNRRLKQLLISANTALKEHHKNYDNQTEHERSHNALSDTIATLTGKVANIEKERREEKIASLLQGAYNEDELKRHILKFARSGMLIEDISKAVAPLKAKNKKTIRHDNKDKKAKTRNQT